MGKVQPGTLLFIIACNTRSGLRCARTYNKEITRRTEDRRYLQATCMQTNEQRLERQDIEAKNSNAVGQFTRVF